MTFKLNCFKIYIKKILFIKNKKKVFSYSFNVQRKLKVCFLSYFFFLILITDNQPSHATKMKINHKTQQQTIKMQHTVTTTTTKTTKKLAKSSVYASSFRSLSNVGWRVLLMTIFVCCVATKTVEAQCPWQREIPELQTSCICSYNLGRELSVQCDQVSIR